MTSSRQQIRHHIRQARNALSSDQQYQASIELTSQVNSLPDMASAQLLPSISPQMVSSIPNL
ncbi:hypothetical protein JCM19233_4138 [Vibrio astriarenae]|nr:hypothetical protein JCM19233_4138 [Vibrio sp. C7]